MFNPRSSFLLPLATIAGLGLTQTISLAAPPRVYPRAETHEGRGIDRAERLAVPPALDLSLRSDRDTVAAEPIRTGKATERNPSRIPARRDHPSAATDGSPSNSVVRRAADWAALETFRLNGRREYFRVGLYRGLQASLDAPVPEFRTYNEGHRRGWRDPQARIDGFEEGLDSAVRLAEERAASSVEAQFRDLSREPQNRPDPGTPYYEPQPPIWDSPELNDLLVEYPLYRYVDSRHAGFLEGWGFDALRLRNCRSYEDVYRADWRSTDRAFALWQGDPRRSATFRRLESAEARRQFRVAFDREYVRRLSVLYSVHGQSAHDRGFEEGWDYGSFLREELAFRRGYDAGFAERFLEASAEGFRRQYSTEYRRQYAQVFDEWSSSPRPRIEDWRLVDGDEDGVFEPGETLRVYYSMANYGGAGVELKIELEGDVLRAAGNTNVWLAPRRLLRAEIPVEAQILGSIPTRTRTDLELRAAGFTARVPLEVAYPLSIAADDLRVRRNDLDGELVVEVRVRNASRNPKQASVRMSVNGAARPVFRSFGRIAGAGSLASAMRIEGLDPLDLMAGQTRIEIQLVGGETLQDTRTHDLTDTVRDLENHDLLTYMIGLSGDPSADGHRLNRARALMLRRLEVDWVAAVRANGNPYKSDFRKGGERTALGELVNTIRTSGDSGPFLGIRSDVIELVRDQRGAHPFLRKYAQRLASRLP